MHASNKLSTKVVGKLTSNFPKMGFRIQMPKFVIFRRNFDRKRIKVYYKVSVSKNFQRQSCSAINCLSNGINILVGDDPVPVKIEPKCTDPQ